MKGADGAPDRDGVVAALRELVEALDRRMSQVERVGEVRIAHEAAALRQQAAKRIEDLSSTQRAHDTSEGDRSHAEMTDDGGPARSE